MLTRRETVLGGTALVGVAWAVLAGIGISPAFAEPLPEETPVDRELRLAVSDAFARQVWIYGGQSWLEVRDALVLHEDETVRIAILNDQKGDRVVSFGDAHDMVRVRQGEMKSVVLRVSSLDTFSIAVAGEPMISRTVTVRPNYGAHANVV